MHPLRQYLKDMNESINEFSLRVGASRQTLYRVIGRGQAPKSALARRIVEATGGAVSFDCLYPGSTNGSGEVVGFNAGAEEPLLDQERVKVSLAIVINHLTPPNEPDPPDEAADIAAEAVVNTYAALNKITTRQGPDRLCQALRPVLEEILREYSDSPPPSGALDRGAELAAQLYFQSWKFGRSPGPSR